MKLKNIVEALPALQKLASEDLTIKTLYKVKKLMERLDKEIEFYNSERNKAIEQLCKLEGGTKYTIPDENREALNKRLQELLDVTVEPPIESLVIFTDENMRLSYKDLKALEGILEIRGFDEEQEV